MKYNPFRPNSAIGPGMFVGRINELKSIEQSLLQTKNGNPQHFIVHGERGIGKTSLLTYVSVLSRGGLEVEGTKFNFLTVAIDLGGCNTPLDIIRKLARGFRTELRRDEALKEKAAKCWEWVSNWEVLGVKYNKPAINDNLDVEEIIDDFVIELADFVEKTNEVVDGVFFIIDEADSPPAEAGLGQSLKSITERLGRADCYNVLFGLAGLPQLIQKLRTSHESSPRIFHVMVLEPLLENEREGIVRICLDEANKKNEISTSIQDDALSLLALISEGYPHFVHQFGYCAFDVDVDNDIDTEDVSRGAFGENGAMDQLGSKFFSEMYHAKISSEQYRSVLHTMATYGDGWVSRKEILAKTNISDANISNALSSLKNKDIIIQHEAKRGVYRLPTKSFAAWINAYQAAEG